MAIIRPKLKSIEIPMRLPSTLSDFRCADGEVESFSNVPWLSEAASADSEGGATSASDATTLSLSSRAAGPTLPYGAHLLAVHSPEALGGSLRYLVLLPSDILAVCSEEKGVQYLPAVVSRIFGEIRMAIPYGDVILLICEKRCGWVIFNPADSGYRLSSTRPQAPDVTFSLAPVHVAGYTSAAGAWPELSVAVDLPLELVGSENAVRNWLELGSASAVSELVRSRVFRAVGEAVERYMSEVRALGYYLTPVAAIASFDETLPSRPAVVGTPAGYASPCARLAEWNYHAESLSMKINFSMTPLALSASFSIPDSMQPWIPQFRALRFHVGEESEWRLLPDGKLSASGLTSYTDPATGARDGLAFRFPALPEGVPEERLRKEAPYMTYRTSASVALSNAAAGAVTLPRPGKNAETFVPDWRDHTEAWPEGGTATDSGIVLFGGKCVPGTAGNIGMGASDEATQIPLEKSVLVSAPDRPYILRHLCHAGEGTVVAVMQGSGARGSGETGKHPLHIISSDGIRLLSADGKGGYMPQKLLSREGAVAGTLTAADSERLYYMSSGGLRSLLMSSKTAEISGALPEGDWNDMHAVRGVDALLLTGNGTAALFDLRQGEPFPLEGISLREICEFEGRLLTLASDGTLLEISAIRRHRAEQQTQPDPAAVLNDTNDLSDPNVLNTPALAALPTLTTRPLKLGSPFTFKRIRSVTPLAADVTLRLEGSDDLLLWCTLAEGRGPLRALRPASFRFLRITATAPSADGAPSLALLRLSYTLADR